MKKHVCVLLLVMSFNLIFSQEKLQDSLVIKFITNVIKKTQFPPDSENFVSNSKRDNFSTVKIGVCDLSMYPIFKDCSNVVILKKLKDNSESFIFKISDGNKDKDILFNIIFLSEKVQKIQTNYLMDSFGTKIYYKNGDEFAQITSKTKDKTSKMKIPLTDIEDVLYFYINFFL